MIITTIKEITSIKGIKKNKSIDSTKRINYIGISSFSKNKKISENILIM